MTTDYRSSAKLAQKNTDLTDEPAERPDDKHVVEGSERDADDDEDEVGNRQSNDENVRRWAHALIGHDDDDHRQISDQSEHGDQSEYDRHHDPDDPFELLHLGNLDRVRFRFRFRWRRRHVVIDGAAIVVFADVSMRSDGGWRVARCARDDVERSRHRSE